MHAVRRHHIRRSGLLIPLAATLAACATPVRGTDAPNAASFAASPASTTASRTRPVTVTTRPDYPSETVRPPSSASATSDTARLLDRARDRAIRAETLGPLPRGVDLRGARRAAAVYGNGCHLHWGATRPGRCVYGDTTSETVIVITGDSHAAHWFGAFEQAATEHGWRLVTVTKAGCPAADVPVYSMREDIADQGIPYTACADWRPRAQRYIRSLRPDLVIFPMLTRRGVIGSPGRAALPAWEDGLGRSIDAVRTEGTGVLILGDTPKTNGNDVPGCVRAQRRNIVRCGNPRDAAVFPERMAMLARTAQQHTASFVDVSDWFCGPARCGAVIGRHVVYRDNHHLSDGFSRSLGPLVGSLVRDLLEQR